jgi:hypothetical protein
LRVGQAKPSQSDEFTHRSAGHPAVWFVGDGEMAQVAIDSVEVCGVHQFASRWNSATVGHGSPQASHLVGVDR